ncbi:hypothetical protein CRUP_021686 [Coryphaenoides rupestris]|nr:hypothetical protein CRUP_021686 [Coryphaenoides rupestris]
MVESNITLETDTILSLLSSTDLEVGTQLLTVQQSELVSGGGTLTTPTQHPTTPTQHPPSTPTTPTQHPDHSHPAPTQHPPQSRWGHPEHAHPAPRPRTQHPPSTPTTPTQRPDHAHPAPHCLILGEVIKCDCGPGYMWTNEVCYNTTTCCSADTCTKPITDYFSTLCIPKFQGTRDNIADFEANVSAVFETWKLLEVLGNLEMDLGADIVMDTVGLVEITSTAGPLVCYEATPVLTCTFNEVTSVAVWSLSRGDEFAELGNGSVSQITSGCGTAERPSCVVLTLQKVKGTWAGVYKCGFSEGSVQHTAQMGLAVALLPDTVEMLVDPLTIDCSEKTAEDSVDVRVTTIIPNTTEGYTFMDGLHYLIKSSISCKPTDEAHYVTITFLNQKEQKKATRLDMSAIYPGAPLCEEVVEDGRTWPRAPSGATVFNRTCEEGRVGYASRTCEGSTWLEVFFQCVSVVMFNVMNDADNFKQGFGATQSGAEGIFGNLLNASIKNSGSKEDIADLSVSINILTTMAQASENVALQEPLLPNMIGAASNMLNQSWGAVNATVGNSMSSNYLESMEGLVHNIVANNSKGVLSDNLQLNICDSLEDEDCNSDVFGVAVNLSKSQGIIKTMAVRNLAEKLQNNYKPSKTASLVVSATVQSSSNKHIDIQLDFPKEYPDYNKVRCVFWNITSHQWSEEGCMLDKSADGNRTVCSCTHLTPFSALMSKTPLDLPFLKELTYLGLGVSICALLLFLIIEALVWSAVVKSNLSHFRHTSLVNIAISLLLADLSFLASAFPNKISETMCLVFTVCKHFFFLTMFCWMLCLSVMLVHQLIFVFNPLRKSVFMFLSSIVGYVLPMLIVGSSYVYYEYTGGDYLKKETCWLTYNGLLRGSIHAFLLPVGVVVLTNLFSMVVVILTLTKTTASDKSDKDTAKSILKVVLFLTPAFGVTWILGFIQLLLGDMEEEDSVDGTTQPFFVIFIHYAFTILNTFQVREEVLKIIMSKTSSDEKSAKNTTNTSKK